MLTVTPDFRFRLYAGEAFLHEVKLLQADGSLLDINDQSLTFTLYTPASRTPEARIEYERVTDEAGVELFRIARDGRFSEGLLEKTGLLVEVSRRFRLGREVLGIGGFIVDRTSASLDSLDSEPIGRVAARLTITLSANPGAASTVAVSYVPYSAAYTPPATDTTPDPYSFTDQTGAARSTAVESNVVGITGIDAPAAVTITGGEYKVGNGSYTSQPGSISAGQSLRLRLTTSSSYDTLATATVTVGGVSDAWTVRTAAEVVTPTPTPSASPSKVGELPHRLFTVGAGEQTFSVASGFAGGGLSYSVTAAQQDADFTIDAATGEMVVQTDVATSGNVTVRATNSAGYAEQVFPLFVVASVGYTILAREPNGTVTVESLAPAPSLQLVRQNDGSVVVQETV